MSDDSQQTLGSDKLRAKAQDVIGAFKADPELVKRFDDDPIGTVASLGFPESAAEDLVIEVGPSLHADVQAYICNRTCRYTCKYTCILTSAVDGGDDSDDDGDPEMIGS
jgi:hypothetical protein